MPSSCFFIPKQIKNCCRTLLGNNLILEIIVQNISSKQLDNAWQTTALRPKDICVSLYLSKENNGCQSVDKGGKIWIFRFRRLFIIFWPGMKIWINFFFSVNSKMAEKRIFAIFVDSDLNHYKASQVSAFSPRVRASLQGSLWKFGWWLSTILWT